jgi:trehalose 6-phosphate phosphatase
MKFLAALTEWPADTIEAATEMFTAPVTPEDLFKSVAAARESVLLLDFDGTLAPFRIDPSQVRPWAGVANLLDAIQEAGRTRLAIITGRPAQDVASQLGMRKTPEIWGLHGAERLYRDGRIDREELIADEQSLLEAARSVLRGARLGVRVEDKPNAVVVHWRGRPPHSIAALRSHVLQLFRPYAGMAGVTLLQFDGGIELRAGRNKGDAVRMILAETDRSAPVAYLGDDATDEHAFEALDGRGLAVLVRREWRPGAAKIWLRPPSQLREFLESWLRATRDLPGLPSNSAPD